MKAFEARRESIQPQYDSARREIKQAIEWGWKSTHVGKGTLYPEVAKMIAKDGYDIKIVKRADDSKSYNEVSWENAEEGKEGDITYIDESKDPADAFMDYLLREKEKETKKESMKKPKNKANAM